MTAKWTLSRPIAWSTREFGYWYRTVLMWWRPRFTIFNHFKHVWTRFHYCRSPWNRNSYLVSRRSGIIWLLFLQNKCKDLQYLAPMSFLDPYLCKIGHKDYWVFECFQFHCLSNHGRGQPLHLLCAFHWNFYGLNRISMKFILQGI